MIRPLDGITVVSLEHAIAAPLCSRQLADLGARVIKVERPGTGDFARAYDINYPVLLARGGGLDLMRALGNAKAGLPFTLALDRRGAVVASRLGLLSREQLAAAARRAAEPS